jgi:hypothetical protein
MAALHAASEAEKSHSGMNGCTAAPWATMAKHTVKQAITFTLARMRPLEAGGAVEKFGLPETTDACGYRAIRCGSEKRMEFWRRLPILLEGNPFESLPGCHRLGCR